MAQNPLLAKEKVSIPGYLQKEVDSAAKALNVTKGTLHYYIRTLGLETHKFPLDRQAYLATVDFERVKTLKDQADQGKADYL